VDWLRWVIVALALVEAGWMAFDGTRALIVGDYVTPRTGEYAGQLGPWTKIVSAVGIEPRSSPMKAIFVAYGAIWIAFIGLFAAGFPPARLLILIAAFGSLWYLWIGTVSSAVIIVLILIRMILFHK
jgi:hypothetical protein